MLPAVHFPLEKLPFAVRIVDKAGAPDADFWPDNAVDPLAQAHGKAAVKGILAQAAADCAELPRQEGVPLHLVAEAFFNDKYVQKIAHVGKLRVIELYRIVHRKPFQPGGSAVFLSVSVLLTA